jgi:hypothetical protein
MKEMSFECRRVLKSLRESFKQQICGCDGLTQLCSIDFISFEFNSKGIVTSVSSCWGGGGGKISLKK